MADQPTPEIADLLDRFERVRVIDLSTIDLERYRFDFDLTFSVLFMNPDGTIYHRYGSRDHRSPDARLSFESFGRVAKAALEAHARHREREAAGRDGSTAKAGPDAIDRDRTIWSLEPFAKRAKRGECVHCHSVLPAQREVAQAQGRWRPSDVWVYPDPARIGLELDPKDHARVVSVVSGSPSDEAGIEPGDRISRVAGGPIASMADLQVALHDAKPTAIELEVVVEREGRSRPMVLALPAGWKEGSPLDFSWRPSKWTLVPQPGFGGRFLSDAERSERGIESAMALEVTYLVTWGPRAHVGKAVHEAGLRKGDIVTAIDGRRDFASPDHVHAWFRLQRRAGETVTLERAEGRPVVFQLQP